MRERAAWRGVPAAPLPPELPLLFVYGSLRPGSGHPMSALLEDYATSLGPATLVGELLDVQGQPGAVPPQDGGRGVWGGREVRGDVLRLRDASLLRHLDAFEGADYERATREVRLWDGSPVSAWVYVYRGPRTGSTRVPGGDWLSGA